ncbi:MAG: hypothetical protein V4793_12695, partial [Paraburkholderia tropica]
GVAGGCPQNPPVGCCAPPGGPSALWLRLPGHPDLAALRAAAIAEKLIYDPGEPFFHGAMTQPHLRLGFSSIPLERIEPGVQTLARLVRQCMRRAGARATMQT